MWLPRADTWVCPYIRFPRGNEILLSPYLIPDGYSKKTHFSANTSYFLSIILIDGQS